MTLGLGKFTGSFAFCSVVAMMVGSAGLARADGLPSGGSCCADLEERIAELEATTARKGNRKVSLTISGQVTTALMAWDNGDRSDVYIVDPPTAGGTLFNLNGSAKISPSLSAGFHIQVGLDKGARSHQVTENDDDGGQAGDTLMVMTLANWYLDHKSLGRVTVGRINTATAGISGIDLGGTAVIANVNVGYWNREFSVGGSGGLVRWGDLMGGGTINGSTLGRANAISYTSPTFGGFSVSAAWGENDMWDAALRYAGELGGFRIAAGIGYAQNLSGLGEVFEVDDAGAGPGLLKGSASILHIATGLFVTGAFVRQDNVDGQDDTTLYYVQGGIAKNWTGLGNTVFYGEWARVDDGINSSSIVNGGTSIVPTGGAPNFFSSEVNVYGFGVVQHIDAAAMELFLSYRRYSGEVGFGNLFTFEGDDMDVVMGGARIRF